MTIYSFARWLRVIKNLSEEEIAKCWRDAEAYGELCREYEEYKNGEILDPTEGKVYNCAIWIEGASLKLRGYWGWFYRTETWERVK